MNLRRLFPTLSRHNGSKRDRAHRRCIAFETLEERELLSGGLQVNMNVNTIEFANVMENARVGWRVTSASQPGMANISGLSLPTMDANGYPIGLGSLSAQGDALYTTVFTGTGQHYPTGTYTLTFDGSGTVAINDYVDPIRYFTQGGGAGQPHNITISGTHPWGIAIAITSSNPSEEVSNIRLVEPGLQATYQTEPFDPQFLSGLQSFSTLRLMDAMLPNISSSTTSNGQSGELTWSERTPPTYYTQNAASGVSVEYLVDLCNILHDNMWVSMPVNADSNYEQNFAQYVLDNLDPNLDVYVEYGNELWNSSYSYDYNYVSSYATANGLNGPQAMADMSTYDCWDIWRQVFAGQTNRMLRVVANQFSLPYMFNTEIARLAAISSPSDPDHGFDVIAGGAYFGPDTSSFNAQTTVQQIEAAETSALNGLFTRELQAFMTMTDSWEKQLNQNIPVIMYEGGLNIGDASSSPWYSAFVAAQTDPGQYAVTMNYLNELANAGVQGVNYFDYFQYPNAWGEYGSMDYIGEPSSLTPKYNALVDFINNPSLEITGLPQIDKTGTAETFTVTVINPGDDGIDTGYTGTVQFSSSSDAQALLPPTYTFTASDDGQHTFSVTFNTVGAQSITATDAATSANSGTAPVIVSPIGTSAAFIQEDATTQGNWIGTYGMQGYDFVDAKASLPSYATVTTSGASGYTWTTSTTDPRALQVPGSSNRIAAVWFSGTSFEISVDLTHGQAHDIALYVDDWDNKNRSEQIQISDALTGTILDTERISSFSGGAYLDWQVSGNIVITVTNLGGAGTNAIVNGLFLDPVRPTLTWVKPASIVYGMELGGTQLDATASFTVNGATMSVPGTFTYTPAAGTILPAGNGRKLSVTFTPTDTTDYTSATATVTINVLQATPTLTWAEPATIVYGTALGGTQCNAAASYTVGGSTVDVPGTFTYNPAAGTILPVGNGQTLSVTFTPTDMTDYTTASATATINVTAFIQGDTTTRGNWVGAYGTQGYDFVGGKASLPSYATVTTSGASGYTWTTSTTDPRALQDPSGSGRVAACWDSGTSFTVDVNLTDGQAHDIALYVDDWDNKNRSEQIQISDALTGTILDTERISSFSGGAYLDWQVSGNIVITVTNLGGAGTNAIVNGLFLDPVRYTAPIVPTVSVTTNTTPVAAFIQEDTTTQGNWIGAYGTQGYDVTGDTASLPSYATVTTSGASGYTWTTSTTDPRALQDPSGSGRVAACWDSGTSFTVDVNLTDGQTHDLTIYADDWDNKGRSEQIQLLNASTGSVLDTETISSFSSGVYLEWAVGGNVAVKVTNLSSSSNALITGLFLDPATTLTATDAAVATPSSEVGAANLVTVVEIGTVDFTDSDSQG